jgi:hypothetical protein
MSRSYRKTPITGITMARSEKTDKRLANRRLRRKVKTGALELRLREVSDIWGFEKDGKIYWRDLPEKEMRK